MGETLPFQGKNAKYRVSFEGHSGKIRIPRNTVAVVIENIAYPDLTREQLETEINRIKDSRWIPGYRTRAIFRDPGNRNKEIWFADVAHRRVFIPTLKDSTQRLIVLPLTAMQIGAEIPLVFKGKIRRREALRKFISWKERSIPPSDARSAIIAIKTAEYIANAIGKAGNNRGEPEIGLLIGAGHSDIVEYLKDPGSARKFILKKRNRRRIEKDYSNPGKMFRCAYDGNKGRWIVEEHHYPLFREYRQKSAP